MKNKRHTIIEKDAIFQDILHELSDTKMKSISKDEITKMFSKKDCFVHYKDFKELNIRERLLHSGIYYGRLSGEEKKLSFQNLLKILVEDGITNISNKALIDLMKEHYGVSLRDGELHSLGLWTLLERHGIENKHASLSKMPIIEQVIDYVLDNNIEINNVAHLHKYTEQFGSISRATLDNHLDYIQKHISIKNIKETKRIKALNMTDEEIMIQAAIYYIKKNVYKLTAAEFRKYTNSRYRMVDIKVIKSYRKFFVENYGLEIISIDSKQDNQNHHLKDVLDFLKTKKIRYIIEEVDLIDVNVLSNTNNDVFIFKEGAIKKLKFFWDEYTTLYINELAKNRINVKSAFLCDDSNNLKIDTEKKEVLLLAHEQLNIETMTLLEFIKLTMLTSKASYKAYGIHMQNMYIGFLLFLYSKNQLIIPFSYLYDVCYAEKKVQIELELFLSEHPINKQFLQAIKENRLNVKDDKYKRIFQFFLLCFPRSKPISSIAYQDLSSLQDRSKNNFKRVVEILNTLGANIIIDKAKEKYTEKYNMYKKYNKYSKLIELFNKTMNRVYKLGEYSREDNIYKKWSTQYALFFDFIEENYTNSNISESFLYQIFDYPDEERVLTYQEYIQEQKLSASSKDNRFTPLIVAFSNSDIYPSLNTLKDKKPIFNNTSESDSAQQKRAPITNPIVLTKLEDILRNRPPKSDYFNRLNIDEKYTKWWSHYEEIAPFEPLILLMHLYIPARGINFRLADRNSFLVKNEQSITTGYHFTHDKNKKRKKPYIAPNIWGDDLEIIEDFVEYSKIHFNTLKPIKYDKQNPKGILPLFPNSKGNSFYSESQHMKYWKRVLLKAQIELNNEKHEEDILLIYPNADIKIPTSPNDVNKFSQSEMEKFTIRYDLHSLRHTGATRYANAGMPMGLVALLTGHMDMNVLQDVYIELDEEKMISLWQNMQYVDIGDGMSLSKAGKALIDYVHQTAKEVLLEESPEKLLSFLEKEKFITIGAYVSEGILTKYTLEDFSKIDPVFWSFRSNGICTSSQCPQGFENRCSLCPHFMTSQIYAQKIVMQINLQNFRLGKYVNMIIENREQGNPQNNENIRKSALLEAEDMIGWTKILRTLDESLAAVAEEEVSTNQKELVSTEIMEKPIFSLAHIVNSDHALLKLVYDGLESKEFEHESLQDASEKIVGKIIRYAARNGKYKEIDGADKYGILEWFYPVYQNVKSLEKNAGKNDELLEILNGLSEKPSENLARLKEIKTIETKEEK